MIGQLAKANLRDGVRRSASTAAPLIVLIALVLGQSGALTSFTAAGESEQRAGTAADLVVEATGPVGIATIPGVAAASTEIEVLVVDPSAYERAHPGTGSLADLAGRAVVGGPAGGDGGSRGDTVGVRVGGVDLGRLPVVAAVPTGMGGGANLLLPPGLVPAADLAQAPSRTFVAVQPGFDVALSRPLSAPSARCARWMRGSSATPPPATRPARASSWS